MELLIYPLHSLCDFCVYVILRDQVHSWSSHTVLTCLDPDEYPDAVKALPNSMHDLCYSLRKYLGVAPYLKALNSWYVMR